MTQINKPPYPSNSKNRKPYQQNNTFKNRKNERIRANEVRVIGPDGSQIGVLPTSEALKKAREHGLDLVEISPTAKPPVCKIIDFGKFMYEQTKKTKDTKSTSTKVKEVKIRTNIDQHDYETKLRHCEEFLNKNHKVKLTLMFKGREADKPQLGLELVKKAIADLAGMGTADNEPKVVGRSIIISITPLPAAKRRPKFIHPDDDQEDTEE